MRLDPLRYQTKVANTNSAPRKKVKAPPKKEAGTPVGDRAHIGSQEPGKSRKPKPGFVKRLAGTAKKLTLYGMIGVMGLNAMAPSLIHTADTAWNEGNKTELLAGNQNLSPEQNELARAEMATLGDGAVAYLADQGVKVHITNNDAQTADVLIEHMNFQEVSPQQLQEVGKKALRTGDHIQSQESIQLLGNRVDSLQKEQQQEFTKWMTSIQKDSSQSKTGSAFGGMGTGLLGGGGSAENSPMIPGGGMSGPMTTPGGMGMMGGLLGGQNLPPELAELNADLFDAQQMLLSQVSGQLTEAGLSGMVKPAQLSGSTISVEGAVMMSGAKTAEEKAEFRDLIYQWNGDRIQEAQADGLQSMESNLANVANPQARDFLANSLEAARENPDMIPMSTAKGTLLLPNFRYNHFDGQEAGKTFRIPVQENIENYVQGAAGVYNRTSRHSQVDSDALQPEYGVKVAVHELAHALDHVIEEENPDFHKTWHAKVRNAYETAEHRHSHGHEVNSEYGMTNYREYVAEGVERLVSNPEHLQETDPALFELSSELLKEANRLGESDAGSKIRVAALQSLSRMHLQREETTKTESTYRPTLSSR